MADDRFVWHKDARLIGADGRPVDRRGATDAPTDAAALVQAMALAEQGRAFRIGASDQPPAASGTPPVFETLTSGTSGTPRRICRRQSSWTASFALHEGLFGLGPGQRVASLGALVHSLSLYSAIEGLHLGAEVHLMAALRPDRQRQALAARAISHLYATPAQLRLLSEAAGPDLPALRHLLVGGSKLDPALRARLARLAPAAALREFYGAAETSFITLSGPDLPEASVGQAYSGVDLSIRDEAGQTLAGGAVGEVWVRSPYLFNGYGDGQPGPARWQGEWLSVGEIGWLEAGCLFLAGRAARMITIADQNVFPEEIEVFLASLPGIARVAVLPRPDALRGTVLIAVALRDPAFALSDDDLLRPARDRFGPLKAPRQVIWRVDWPDLPSGKTDLARLAREVAS